MCIPGLSEDCKLIKQLLMLESDKISELSRGEITSLLSDLLEYRFKFVDKRGYWSKEVTFDWATSHSIRVDYMHFKPLNNTVSGIEKGDVYCYEVKSSVEDFRSKNGHNFLGDYNYYVMPKPVFDKVRGEIPWHIGVYCAKCGELRVFQKAKRKDRMRPVSECLLMMFRSAVRDIER